MNLCLSFAASEWTVLRTNSVASLPYFVTFISGLNVITRVIIIILNAYTGQNLRFANLILCDAFLLLFILKCVYWSVFKSHSTAQNTRFFVRERVCNGTDRLIFLELCFDVTYTFMFKTLVFKNVFWHVDAVISYFTSVHLSFHFISFVKGFYYFHVSFDVFWVHVKSSGAVYRFLCNLWFCLGRAKRF